METSYLGGILLRPTCSVPESPPGPLPGTIAEDWGWMADDAELFVHAPGSCCRLFTWDALALLIRGRVRGADTSAPLDIERMAEEIRSHYLEHGHLAVDGLEGSFSLVLLDGQAQRVMLYRNVMGTGHTYYHAGPNGLLFGSNLADLVDVSRVECQPNRQALPSFFLYRLVPGRDTLFEDFYRLLPGEQVCWDARGLTRLQRHTLTDLADVSSVENSVPAALDRLEQTMEEILGDCSAMYPEAVNLLSGGVDSSYLQAIWNRVASGQSLPRSVSISVDHPCTWPDTDYAITASRALGTRHTLIPADRPYAEYLVESLATTGEPPHHVQSAYFGSLARELVKRGIVAGICGEGADSLFGLSAANQIHNARTLRKLFPLRMLRCLGKQMSGLVRWSRLTATFQLANGLEEYADLQHPINLVGQFCDLPATQACFGTTAVSAAAGCRRTLLDRLGVSQDPMQRIHAVGFFGEALESAGLWTTMFNHAGVEMLCPFVDTRLWRLMHAMPARIHYPFRRPKEMLKRALTRYAPRKLAYRPKLAFGQPIFEWLSPGGQLRPLVDEMDVHDFVEPDVLARTRAQPTWFLYSLLCYDLWYKLFIKRSLSRPEPARLGREMRTFTNGGYETSKLSWGQHRPSRIRHHHAPR